jgi:hypothetical protein
MADDANLRISDTDRDSLHILPLAIIPLETPALRRARMIKNVRLDSVVELFQDKSTGSGQIGIEDLPREFGWSESPSHPDHVVARKLALLPTYDVYSLRLLLRDLGIRVNDHQALRLSEQKNRELTDYMTGFTRPLIKNVYGNENINVDKFEDIVNLFSQPDVENAIKKLKIMAARLEIRVHEVPKFLEDYGDIFLSVSYYKDTYERVEPIVCNFLDSLNDLEKNYQLRREAGLMGVCRTLQDTVAAVMDGLADRFSSFDRATDNFWTNVSAERFRQVQQLITSHHITTGGVLCALSVKMDAWIKKFPSKNIGGPKRRAEFVMTEIRHGVEKIQRIQEAAPLLSAVG